MEKKEEIKEFKVSLINETISISLDNLFTAIENTVKIEENKKALKPIQKKGFRKPKAVSQSIKAKIEADNKRLTLLTGRQQRVSMLYSFIALEHVVYDIITKLRKEGDEDLLTRKYEKGANNKKAIWNINQKTDTVQIGSINKCIRYLLSRDDMKSEDCSCSELINDPKINSAIANGHKIKNIFVHGISAIKNVTLTPVGKKEVKQLDDGNRIETQTMNSKINYIGETTYYEAIQSLKNDGIFECQHADGDPGHICLGMAIQFSSQSFRMIRALAKHYNVGVSAFFYMKTNMYKSILATNQVVNEHQKTMYDEIIDFSSNTIIEKYNEAVKKIKSD